MTSPSRVLRHLALIWPLAGCSAPEASSPAAPATPAGVAGRAEPAASPDVDGTCSPTRMRACFGPMVLVAGLGKIGRKGEDGWKPEYEGALATGVELSRPHFAMADGGGNLWIADKDANAVRRVSDDGRITTPAQGPELARPNGLWVGSDDRVFVLDLGHSAVKRLAPDGTLTTLFEVPGGISLGRGLWVSPDASVVYVASGSRVLRWTPASGVQTHADGFRGLANLVVDDGGNLVVTDRVAGRVYRLDEAGTRTPIAGNGLDSGGGDGSPALETALPGVRAVWFDRSGGYFLGTHESSAVWYVDVDDIIHRFLGEPDISEVRGLSQDAAGNVIIVSNDGGFVWKLERRPPPG